MALPENGVDPKWGYTLKWMFLFFFYREKNESSTDNGHKWVCTVYQSNHFIFDQRDNVDLDQLSSGQKPRLLEDCAILPDLFLCGIAY